MTPETHSDSTDQAGESTAGTTRRRVLRGAATTAVAASGLGTVSTATAAQTQQIKEIDFRDGVPPVSDGPQGRDEVVFHAHGYTQSDSSVSEAEKFRASARDFGYDGAVAAVTWDDSGFPGTAERSARETGASFADWLDDFRAENPGTTIRLLGYSMGAIVVMEAVGAIDGAFTIANADMIGSYERSDAPCQGSEFFDDIETSCLGMYNYWSANDGIARLGSSGGASCAGSETPATYADVDVSDSVGGHGDYKDSPACVERIVDNFEDDGGPGSLSVATGTATDVGRDRATLSGSLESLGESSSAEVAFQYRPSGDESWRETPAQTLSAPGQFTETVTALAPDTAYEFQAVGDTTDETDAGAVATFVTGDDGGDVAPAIDSFDADSSCFWSCSFETSWAVSDADADLATVVTELYGSSDQLIDSAESGVAGAEASGTHDVQSGWFDDPDRLVLRVIDEAGNTATDEIDA